MTEELSIRIVANDQTKTAFNSVGNSVRGLGKIALGGIAIGFAASTAAIYGASRALEEFTALAKVQRDVELQLAAVHHSTGAAVRLTTQELKDYASELQGMTNFGDEAIIGAEALLMTFTNIQGEIFKRTLPAILDVSQAMGQDLKSSTLLVGKALNDPITGLASLTRVGIQFTDQQKEQIKVMTESGQAFRARWIILDELERQFGGSAMALADPVIQLGNTFGDFKEMVGGVSLLIKTELAKVAMPLLQAAMEKVKPLLDAFPFVFDLIKRGIKDILGGGTGLAGFENAIYAIGSALGISEPKLMKITGTFRDMYLKGIDLWHTLVEVKDKVVDFLKPVTDWIKKNVTVGDGLTVLGVAIGAVVIPAVLSLASSLLPVIAGAALLFAGVKLLKKGWDEDWGGMKTKLIDFWENTAKPALTSIGLWLGENIPKAIDALKKAWNWISAEGNPIIAGLALILKVSLLPALALVKIAWGAWTGGFQGIVTAVKEIIFYIKNLGTELADLILPDWMTPGSPTPWENGLVGVGSAMGYLNNTSMPQLRQNLQETDRAMVTNNYNLSLASGRSTESVRQDFETQRAIAGIP